MLCTQKPWFSSQNVLMIRYANLARIEFEWSKVHQHFGMTKNIGQMLQIGGEIVGIGQVIAKNPPSKHLFFCKKKQTVISLGTLTLRKADRDFPENLVGCSMDEESTSEGSPSFPQ